MPVVACAFVAGFAAASWIEGFSGAGVVPAGSLFGALDYLTTFPYGCVEQTMSSFLPNLMVTQAVNELGLKVSLDTVAVQQKIRAGIDRLVPEGLRLVHGPGCPVCVTPLEQIDRALAIARRPGVTFCSFGDMLRIPGSAGVYSTFLLLGTYLLVTISVQSFAGIGTHGVGLDNTANQNDVLSVLGGAVFGHSVIGSVLSHLSIFMVLTSAAATTQTTILPNARTTLSMAFHKALPAIFGKVHPRYKTPSFSTISFGVILTPHTRRAG